MRIAVVSSVVTPLTPAQVGGAQAFVCDLARALAGRGHRVRLFCAEGSVVPGVELNTVPVPATAALALVRPGSATARSGRPGPDVRMAFERLFEAVAMFEPDAVSQHAYDAEALELAGAGRVLHTLHLPPLTEEVVAAARACPGRLATVSRSCRQAWAEAAVHGMLILRNGVADQPPASRVPSTVALVAGRISPEKGTHVAIRVAREAGLRPLVAGAVYDPDYYENEVRPLGAETLGAVPRSDLRDIMSRSLVTVMPVAWPEPFGLVAAEAQLAGCPVAGYALGGLPEVVPDGIGGRLVEPGDEAALVSAVREAALLDRSRVRRSALRRLRIERVARAYETALLELAA